MCWLYLHFISNGETSHNRVDSQMPKSCENDVFSGSNFDFLLVFRASFSTFWFVCVCENEVKPRAFTRLCTLILSNVDGYTAGIEERKDNLTTIGNQFSRICKQQLTSTNCKPIAINFNWNCVPHELLTLTLSLSPFEKRVRWKTQMSRK